MKDVSIADLQKQLSELERSSQLTLSDSVRLKERLGASARLAEQLKEELSAVRSSSTASSAQAQIQNLMQGQQQLVMQKSEL